MTSPNYADIRASLEFINILENLIKQGGAPAPSQDSPEYGNKGTGWDYASSTPPPEGAQTFITPGGATWWRSSATQAAPTSETVSQTRQPSSSLIDRYNELIGDRITDADITATWDSGDGSTVRLLAEAKGVRSNGETVSESIKNQLAIHQNLHLLVKKDGGSTRSLNEPSEKEDDAGFDWHYFNADNMDKVKPQGGGANEGSMFKVTMKDGKEFLYKVASGDAQGESYWYSLDRYFGTNISPRIAMMNVGIGPIESAIDEDVGASKSIKGLVADKRLDGKPDSSSGIGRIIKTSIAQRLNWVEERVNRIKNSSDLGGGHFMEWMDGEKWVKDSSVGADIVTRSGDRDFLVSCLDTTSKRESFYAITLYDLLLNNYDRNINNFLLSPDRGIIPIDSGASGEQNIGGDSLAMFAEADESNILNQTPWTTFNNTRFTGFEALVEKGESSIEDIKKEMSDFFDRVYDYDKLQEFSKISGLEMADPYQSAESYEMSELLKNEDNKFRDLFVKNVSDLIFYGIKDSDVVDIKSNKSQSDDWISDIKEAVGENSGWDQRSNVMDPKETIFTDSDGNDVMGAELDRDPNGNLHISSMRSFDRGKGNAGKFLSALTRAADSSDTTMTLIAEPFGEGGLDKEGLKRIYKRNGFVFNNPNDPDTGVREPTKPLIINPNAGFVEVDIGPPKDDERMYAPDDQEDEYE